MTAIALSSLKNAALIGLFFVVILVGGVVFSVIVFCLAYSLDKFAEFVEEKVSQRWNRKVGFIARISTVVIVIAFILMFASQAI